MTKKNEFSELAEKLDKEFKDKERRNQKVIELTKKFKSKKKDSEWEKEKIKESERKDLDKFRIREKLILAGVSFIGGHLLLIPLYVKFPDYGVPLFLIASFSLIIISIAIIDLG